MKVKNKTLIRTVQVESDKATHQISLIAVVNNLTGEEYTERFKENCPGYCSFSSLENLKETLNWAFNGDPEKYEFSWSMNGKEKSWGTAKIYD